MGNGGSTAASCSSLDLANHNHNKNRHHQHHLHEQRMMKYRKQQQQASKGLAPIPKANSKGLLKHSSSNFDLTQNHLIHNHHHQQQPLGEVQQNMSKLSAAWFDGSNQTAEGYSLSNANYGAARPVMVLPVPPPNNPKPVSPVHVLSGAKRSNAGVASRIHQQNQRQLNRNNELRKFSDSLPSLNNLPNLHHHPHQPITNNELISPISAKHHTHSPSPPNSVAAYCRQQQDRLFNQKSAKHNQKQQIIMQQSHSGSRNSNHPNANLVNGGDDPLYQHWSSANGDQQQQKHLMKRAISLSSLHNSHNHHHQQQHYDNHHLNQQQLRLAYVDNCESIQCNKQLVSNCNLVQQSHAKNNDRNESFNNNFTCDLQQSSNRLPIGYTKQQQQQQQQLQYNQQTPLAKKILKFKQVAGNGLSSKRYKQKQKIQQQQQQQGCPVLPPLPRSQSLHELIQLRATENGQRMRTTGTLRGPLGAGEAGNKVNLVVELLENRRQQKMSEQQQEQQVLNRDSTETMLSQASSSDDGIHDVSLSVDQSTGDSRRQFSANSNSNTNTKDSDNYSSNHRLSLNSQEGGRRQRVFNKNNQGSNSRRYQNQQQQQQQHERPQSQRVEASHEQKSIHQQSKSTLKRSVSHSALQNSLQNLELNNDEDESDDLNELAKFLYQFKQRQANKGSPNAETARNPNQTGASSSNQQQSPSSTTSSSGFASSTCTSNSISSTASDELRHKIEPTTSSAVTAAVKAKKSSNGQAARQLGRKKYPAPSRPDERTAKSKVAANDQTLINSNNNKNPISGQLKLSSSLLSIVDEYNSTLQSKDRASPAINASSSSNLASVLLGDTSKMQMHENSSPEARSTADNGSDSSTTAAYCQQQHQLEQLRRYTQMRQMSQSELALNHLTSSSRPKTQIPMVKGKRDHCEQRNNKPYKSKFINIIRRISDKSELVDGKGSGSSNSRSSGRTSVVSGVAVGGNKNGKAVAHQEADLDFQLRGAINQNEMMAPYSKQCKQQKYNHAKLSKTPGVKSSLSESLCDLNFDCDFELIKNCGSTTNEHRRASTSKAGLTGSSLLANSNHLDSGVEQRCQKEMGKKHHQQIINSSKGENNWRLVPTSLSLDKPTGFNSSIGNHQKQQQQQQCLQARQSMNEKENGSRLNCKQHAPATDKLASQSKLKWSASGWLMNGSGSNACGNGCRGDRTKGKELQQEQSSRGSGKSYPSKLISNSGTPLSTGASNNSSSSTREEALIESKSFAKVNSEAKQLLNELDQSLDMVSGRYPFSRKAALSWWKMGDDLVSGTNDQLVMRGGRLVHRNEFASSSSDSEYNFDDDDDGDDDEDDYASINRAMINATFDVDVNQTKLLINDNLNSLAIEPGSPSDSFTFSASNSPVVSPKDTALSAAANLKQSKGENHMSKQSVGQPNGLTTQQQAYSQIRNLSQQLGGSSGNNNFISTAFTSHGVDSQVGCNSSQKSTDALRSIKTTDNGSVCVGGNYNKCIFSHGEGIEDGEGKVELNREDGEIRGKRIGLNPIVAEAHNHQRDDRNTGIKSTSGAGMGMNQDLCAHENEVAVDAKKVHHHTFNEQKSLNTSATTPNYNDNHDSFCEMNITRCLLGGSGSHQFGAYSNFNEANSSGNNDHGKDVIVDKSHHCCLVDSSGAGNNSNRLLSKCQSNRSGKNLSVIGSAKCNQDTRLHRSSSSSSSGTDSCVNAPTTNDRGKNLNCRECCHKHQELRGAGVKSNGLANAKPANKLNGFNDQNDCGNSIQGQQSCGPSQLSDGRCCCLLNASTVAVRNNENTVSVNSPKEAVKSDKQSSPKEQQLNISNNNNGRQMVVVENKPSQEGMRSCNFDFTNGGSSGDKSTTNSSGSCDSNNKRACKCCSTALGGGCSENIFSKPRDLHANGVTYSKTTAPTSEELKNKLITQQKLGGTCHCSSIVSNTTAITTGGGAANDFEIGKSFSKNVVADDAYQLGSPKHTSATTNSSNPSPNITKKSSKESFYYYEMGKIFFQPDDKRVAADKNVAGIKQQQEKQLQQQNGTFATVSPTSATDLQPNSDNCCKDGMTCTASSAKLNDDLRCKVASCHHPSSKMGYNEIKAHYNEDVKVCVSKDNLILDAGRHRYHHHHKFEGVEPSSLEKSYTGVDSVCPEVAQSVTNCSHSTVNGGNCCCCQLPISKQTATALDQGTTTSSSSGSSGSGSNGKPVKRFGGAGLGGKFSSPNRTATAINGEPLLSNPKLSPNGRPLCTGGGGASRFIAKSRLSGGKPICRSNSELVPALDKGTKSVVNVRQCSQNQQQKESKFLFGKLRNSLLNHSSSQAASAENRLSKSSKLACSQVSLVNYYNGNHFVSPFIAHQDEHDSQYQHNGSTTALNDHMNVDDNFILKRKTPNAGLKSRC